MPKLHKPELDYTQTPNSALRDSTISWKAKGLYAYLWSKPDDWDFSSNRMADETSDWVDATRSWLTELEKAGYLTRVRLPSGKMEYYLHIEPKRENPTEAKKPKRENPSQGKSLWGKIPPISNTEEYQYWNNTNTELLLLLHNNKAQALEKATEVSIDSLAYNPKDTEQDQNTERQELQEHNPTPYPLPAESVEKRGNPLVSAIIQAITDYHGWVDGSMVQERRYAKNLAFKIMKHPTWSEFRSRTDSDDEAMYQFIRTLCESATRYQTQWTTSPKWLFYNYIKIISNKPNCSIWILS